VHAYAISPRAVDTLEAHRLTGWTTYAITAVGRMAEDLAGYRGLAVTGRSGQIDQTLSQRVVRPGPAGRPAPHLLGLFPRPGSWDGSDLFVPEGSLWICMSDGVRDALQAVGVVGVRFTRMTEVLNGIRVRISADIGHG
jgi:hypothetical protein